MKILRRKIRKNPSKQELEREAGRLRASANANIERKFDLEAYIELIKAAAIYKKLNNDRLFWTSIHKANEILIKPFRYKTYFASADIQRTLHQPWAAPGSILPKDMPSAGAGHEKLLKYIEELEIIKKLLLSWHLRNESSDIENFIKYLKTKWLPYAEKGEPWAPAPPRAKTAQDLRSMPVHTGRRTKTTKIFTTGKKRNPKKKITKRRTKRKVR